MINKFVQILAITALLISIQSFVSSEMGGKCSGNDEYITGVSKLDKFKLIKDFRVSLGDVKSGKPRKAIYPITLTAGLRYKFIPVNNPSNKGKMKMNLFMNKDEQMLIASNYNPATDKYFPSVEFECKTSITLYVVFSMEKELKGCGVGVVGVSQ